MPEPQGSVAPIPAEPWPAPTATEPLDATVTVPGSKSLTNRYLILGALAQSPTWIRNPLHSRDSALMIDALSQLGATIKPVASAAATTSAPEDLLVHPIPAGHSLPGPITIDCGLAGTVMRFVPPVAALCDGSTTFDGDPSARKRPMAPVLDGLSQLGVTTSGTSLPFNITSDGYVAGGQVSIDASASSQFLSALLLAGPRFAQGVTVVNRGQRLPSPEHATMTVAALRTFGAQVDDSTPGRWHVSPGSLNASELQVEPDLSNAGPFLAAALVTSGTIRIHHWPEQSTQIGDRWRGILQQMGATVSWDSGVLTVTGGQSICGGSFADTGELAPTVAALCSLADRPSQLTGIEQLRGHETDRIAALVTEINRLGGQAEETSDGLIITPRPLHGGVFHSYHDHRMATAGAIIGLAVPGVSVENIATTGKTIPHFPELWSAMLRPEVI